MARVRSDVGNFVQNVVKVKLVKGFILNEAGCGRNGAGRIRDSSNHGGSRVKTAVVDVKWAHADAKDGQLKTRTASK